MEKLRKLDEELMVFLNGLHSPFWDEVMLKATDRFFWIPFYALIVLFLIWKYKKGSILIIVSISLMVISADQITSSFMKPFFERARPCYDCSSQNISRIMYPQINPAVGNHCAPDPEKIYPLVIFT